MTNERWLFVSDVDDTLLGDDEALQRLAKALGGASDYLIIAYNSSRPCASLRQSMASNPALPTPDFLIGAMGTEIQKGESAEPLSEYTRYLDEGWNREQIAALMDELGLAAHSPEYQTLLKASYDVPDEAAYRQVQARLQEAGLVAKVIYSGDTNLDIIPQEAGKGNVIRFLHRYLELPADRVVVSGDSGNDLEMFVAPYRGIVVGNADADLKSKQGDHIYHARATHAGGVLEGLRFWRVL